MAMNYDELKMAAEAAKQYRSCPDTQREYRAWADPAAILALLAEREKLLKVAEAAKNLNWTECSSELNAALKELGD